MPPASAYSWSTEPATVCSGGSSTAPTQMRLRAQRPAAATAQPSDEDRVPPEGGNDAGSKQTFGDASDAKCSHYEGRDGDPQPGRRVFGRQRHEVRKEAADARTDDEAQDEHRFLGRPQSGGESTDDCEDGQACEQNRSAAEPVAQRATDDASRNNAHEADRDRCGEGRGGRSKFAESAGSAEPNAYPSNPSTMDRAGG